MLTTRKLWTVAALVAVTGLAAAQVRTHVHRTGNRDPVGGFDRKSGPIHPGGGAGDAGGKIDPTLGDAGQPMCFGDGSGLQCPTGNNGLPGHGCENSWGAGGALLSAEGTPRISQDSVVLNVGGLPLGTTVVFHQGTQLLMRPHVFGDGIMCLGGDIRHLAAQRPNDWYARFPGPGDQLLSRAGNLPRLGATVYYQVLYRAEQVFGTRGHFNSSNAWQTVWIP